MVNTDLNAEVCIHAMQSPLKMIWKIFSLRF